MKRLLLVGAACCLASGCYVHTHRHGPPPPAHQPAPPPAYVEAQPAHQPAVAPAPEPVQPGPTRVRVSAPATPALVVDAQPTTARRGYEVTVYLRPFQQNVTIYLNGQSLVRRLSPAGDAWIVLIPATADSGHLEVEWNGQRYRSGYITVTP